MRFQPPLRRLFLALNTVFLFGLAHAAPDEAPPPEPPGHHAPCHGQGMPMHGEVAPRPMHGEGMPMLMPPMLHEVKLSEAQEDQLFLIFHEQAPALRSAGKTIQQAEEALHQLSESPRFDEARAKALAEQIGKAHAEILRLHATSMARTLALLSPEQRKQIEEGKRMPPEPEGSKPLGQKGRKPSGQEGRKPPLPRPEY